jgi:2-alkenal reductase
LIAANDPDPAAAPVSAGKAVSTPAALTVQQTSAIIEVASKQRASIVRIVSSRQVPGGGIRDIGSGVVLDSMGHILTNAHVILETQQLKVIFANGEERPAILVGHDSPFTDVAVLKVSPGGLTPADIGDSERLVPGETVIAIGNPLGEFDGSISVGVVSGLNRTRNFDGVLQDDIIQTDTALNVGNSGGGLFNLRGQFVGIPTALLRQSRNGSPVEGIAFVLPSNRTMQVARAIIAANGSLPHVALQAEHIDILAERDQRLPRLQVDEGAFVVSVEAGGIAAQAGIVRGDVITSFGGQAVNRQRLLLNAVRDLRPGDSAKVVLNRGGRIIETEVRFERAR